MSNPIPAVMVYFDEKQRRAVLCVDKSLPPPAVVEACMNSDERGFHTHTWFKRGWMSEASFMHDIPRARDLAAAFVQDVMKSVIEYRDAYDRMEHELNAARKQTTSLENTVRRLVGGLDGTIAHIESEEKRLEVARLISGAMRHTLTYDENDAPEQ